MAFGSRCPSPLGQCCSQQPRCPSGLAPDTARHRSTLILHWDGSPSSRDWGGGAFRPPEIPRESEPETKETICSWDGPAQMEDL